MAFTATIGSVPVKVLSETGFDVGYPALKERGQNKSKTGEPINTYDYEDRTIRFDALIEGTSIDDRDSKYRALMAEFFPTQDARFNTNTFTFNTGGTTGDLTATFYRGLSSAIIIPYGTGEQHNFVMRLNISLVCQPFFRGAQVDLPENLVFNSNFQYCYEINPTYYGLANTLIKTTGGGITDSYTIDDGQKVTVTNTPAGFAWAGIRTPSDNTFAGGDTISVRCEYKCTAAAGSDIALSIIIFCTAGSGHITLLNSQTDAVTDWTEILIEDITVPTGTTSWYLWAYMDSNTAGGSQSFWIRKAQIVKADAIPKGKDGNTIYYDSYFDETPCVGHIENIPGDVDAEARIEFGGDTANNKFFLGSRAANPVEGGLPMIFKYYGSTEANTLDGDFERIVLSVNTWDILSTAATQTLNFTQYEGLYHVLLRTRSSAADPTGDSIYMRIQQLIGGNASTVYTGPRVWFSRATSDWEILNMGVVSCPPAGLVPDTVTAFTSYYLRFDYAGDTAANWDIDYVAFVPVDYGYIFVDIEEVTGASGCVFQSDGIHDPNAFFRVDGGSVNYPPDTTGTVIAWPYGVAGIPITLKPGNNELMLLCSDADTAGDKISEGSFSISYVPRYLFVGE